MAQVIDRKLLFRLREIGFLLDLEQVVEIFDQLPELFDPGCADIERAIVGALHFRQTRIPVVDPGLFLNLPAQLPINEKTALVLKGDEGNWALLVEQVDEILPATSLQPCDLPPLLKNTLSGFYSQVSLLEDEPVIHFNPARYYGSASVAL